MKASLVVTFVSMVICMALAVAETYVKNIGGTFVFGFFSGAFFALFAVAPRPPHTTKGAGG